MTHVWIEWDGGGDAARGKLCSEVFPPLSKDTLVDIRFRCGEEDTGEVVDYWDWGHEMEDSPEYDIVAYRQTEVAP